MTPLSHSLKKNTPDNKPRSVANSHNNVLMAKGMAQFKDKRPESSEQKSLNGLTNRIQDNIENSAKMQAHCCQTQQKQTAQLEKTVLPNPTVSKPEFELLDLVLGKDSPVTDEGLGKEAGDAYGRYLEGTETDQLPSILGQVKAILNQLKTGERPIPERWAKVPPPQIAAIIGHSMQGYLVNPDLRKGDLDMSKYKNLDDHYSQILNTVIGMDRIPPFKGWVYRGQAVPSTVASSYVKGAKIPFKGFTSTTKSALVSDQFKGNKDTEVGMMLTIHSVTGRDISDIAHDSSEQEVLFAPGTEFVIQSVDNSRDILEIVMIEASSGDLTSPIPNRLEQVAREKEVQEKEKAESGPDSMTMLLALMEKGITPPGDVTPEALLKLYRENC